MVVTVHKKQTPQSAHVCHAVLLEKVLQDSYQMKNSYQDEKIISVPKNRKTYFQQVIRSRAMEDFNVSFTDAGKLFDQNCSQKIKWGVGRSDWILSDEGYALQFRRCDKL